MIPRLKELKSRATQGNVIPISLEISADLLTPVSAYLRITRGGGETFLLESVEGGEHLARYSFLGTDPLETLTIRHGKLTVTRRGKKKATEIRGNPLDAMGKALARYRGVPLPELPHFSGGAAGYIGYETVRHLENIPTPAPPFSKQDACLMVFGNVVAFDHVKRRILLISNIFTDHESLESGYRRAKRDIQSMRERLSRPAPSEKALALDDRPEIGFGLDARVALQKRKRFVRSVGRIKEHIRNGDIFQCVLSEQFDFDLRSNPFSIYRSLRTVSPSPYLFFLSMGEEKLLGASPEMLTKVVDRTIETCPIAGTRPRGATREADAKRERDLLASVKEKAEHLMLVDLSRNDLGRVSTPGTVRVENFMHVERFSHVMHLVSNVKGKLKPGQNAWKAFQSCFPAGTLSGAPKIRAMQIIAGLEPVQRGPYGGAVVYQDFSGNMNSCITIRSLFAKGGKGYVQAGAGIVADSNAEREFDEILSKTRAMRKAIAITDADRGHS